MSKTTTTPDPARWMLGGKPPEPQTIAPAKPPKVDDLRNGDTHTGTDPLGRAIGPREDHTKVKHVRNADGEIVKPYTAKVDDKGKVTTKAIDTREPEARAAKIAEATGTKAEAVDEPTPLSPSEVARLHAADKTPEV